MRIVGLRSPMRSCGEYRRDGVRSWEADEATLSLLRTARASLPRLQGIAILRRVGSTRTARLFCCTNGRMPRFMGCRFGQTLLPPEEGILVEAVGDEPRFLPFEVLLTDEREVLPRRHTKACTEC